MEAHSIGGKMSATAWLIGVFLLSLLTLSLWLGRPDVINHMETLAIFSTQETWLRHHSGEPASWLLPTLGGRARINKPPMLSWIIGLSWADLTPENSTVEARVVRARGVSVLFTLLAILSTASLAATLSNRDTAWKAALILATMMITLSESRLASYDTHLLGWITLSLAAGVKLLVYGPAWGRIRRTTVAVISASALGCALLTKGPIAFLFTIVPLAVVGLTLPEEKRPFRLTALAMIFLPAILALIGWFIYVTSTQDNAIGLLFREYRSEPRKALPFWMYFSVVGWVMPWTCSMIGSFWILCRHRSVNTGKALKIAAIWLGLILLIMSCHESKRERYILPVLPAAAILMACWWQRLSDGALPDAWQRVFCHAHTMLLTLASLFIIATVGSFSGLFHSVLVRAHVLKPDLVSFIPYWPVITVGAILLSLTAATWQGLRRNPDLACAFTGIWMAVSFSFGNWAYIQSGNATYPDRQAAVTLIERIPGQHITFLKTRNDPDLRPGREISLAPEARLILYTGKIPSLIEAENLESSIHVEKPQVIVTLPDPELVPRLESVGYRCSGSIHERNKTWNLFVR